MARQMNGEFRLQRVARALKAFFEKRFGMQIDFLTEAPKEPREGDLKFAWALSQAGIWGLRPERALSDSDRNEITGSIKTMLGAIDEMRAHCEDLARLESRLEAAMSEAPSNVIPLRRPQEPSMGNFRPRRRWTLRLDCLIEGTDEFEIHKMASELHDQSSRHAFLNYRELGASKRLIPSELLELGAITLFVPDILETTRSEQQILKYIASLDTEERPLLMVGSVQPYSRLIDDTRVDPELLTYLVRAYIKLTRPFNEYKEQGLIQYFLDSLSENPS
jgi:hypothetical protein